MKTDRKLLICLAAIMILVGGARAQLTRYVRGDGSGSDANNGQSWATAYATIQQALNQINSTWPSNTITINIQASSGGQSYYVASQMGLTASYTNYVITIAGGWTDVDGTPTQNSSSLVADNIAPIDQAGLSIGGASSYGGQSSMRTVNIARMNFTNVTYGVDLSPSPGYSTFYPCSPYLVLDRCNIAAQGHGVYIYYPGYSEGGLNQCARFAATNSVIIGGLGGSGDGVRIISAYPLVDIGSDVMVQGRGGHNINVKDDYRDSSNSAQPAFDCRFLGSYAAPASGYDLVKNGEEPLFVTNTCGTFTRKVAVNGGVVRAKAQSAGTCLTTGTVELNTTVALQLNAVVGVADTPIGTLAARNGQPLLYVNGLAGGGTWTTPALARENRSVLLVRGNGATTYTLTTNDQFRITSAPVVVNGMVAPWLMGTDAGFLSYDGSGVGLKPAVYSLTNTINSAAATDLLLCNALQTQNVDRTVYALRCANLGSITNVPGGPTNILTIVSGGIGASFLSSSSARDTLITSDLKFGATGGNEALVYVGAPSDQPKYSALAGRLITTNGLTKSGYQTLRLDGDNAATFGGPVTVHSGTLQLNHPNALAPNTPVAVFASLAPGLSDSAYRTYAAYLDLYGNNPTLGSLTLGDAGMVRNTTATPVTLTLNGDVAFVGTASPANASAPGAAIASSLANPLTLDMGAVRRTFRVARGTTTLPDLTVSAFLIGSGGLTKSGDGQLNLTCTSNTFSGGITVESGSLLGVTTNSGVSTPFGNPANAITLQRTATILYAPNASGCTSTVGAVTFAGANSIAAGNATKNYTNVLASLDRVASSRGTMIFMGSGAYNYFGYDATVKILIAAPPAVVNGMMAPYFVHGFYPGASPAHVTYDATLGVKACTYNKSGNFTATALTATDLADMTASSSSATTNFTANIGCWALRTLRGISMSGGSWTLTLGSGGLMVNGTVSIAPAVKFGSSGTAEGVVYVHVGTTATLTNSIVTTGGLTKFGQGNLFLGAASPDFSGDVCVQSGTLSLGSNNALGTNAATVFVESGATLDAQSDTLAKKTIKGTGLVTTYANTPFMGTLSPAGENALGTLAAGSLDFRGTYSWEYGATGSDLVQASGLTFGGSATLNVTWLGGGSAPIGTFTLFNYLGADPSLGNWVVNAPSGLAGGVSVDATNRRVVLTLNKKSSGTLLLFR